MRQNLRTGAALSGGFLMKAFRDRAHSIGYVQNLATLKSPMGGEMRALVRESDFMPESESSFLRYALYTSSTEG